MMGYDRSHDPGCPCNGTDHGAVAAAVDARLAADVAVRTADGGGTFESATLLPFEARGGGYIVGKASGNAALLPGSTTAAALADALRRVGQEWASTLVGTWLRPDGMIAVDPVQYVIDRATAERLGRERGQDAVYGIIEGVIELGGVEA